jgi:hypothetical protein
MVAATPIPMNGSVASCMSSQLIFICFSLIKKGDQLAV